MVVRDEFSVKIPITVSFIVNVIFRCMMPQTKAEPKEEAEKKPSSNKDQDEFSIFHCVVEVVVESSL